MICVAKYVRERNITKESSRGCLKPGRTVPFPVPQKGLDPQRSEVCGVCLTALGRYGRIDLGRGTKYTRVTGPRAKFSNQENV